MKNKLMKMVVTGGLALSILVGVAAEKAMSMSKPGAGASIKAEWDGRYQGTWRTAGGGKKNDVEIHVRSIRAAAPGKPGGDVVTSYALVITEGEPASMAVYQIENLDDGSMVWHAFTNTKDNVIATYDGGPSYEVTGYMDDGERMLRLVPTAVGAQLECKYHVDVKHRSYDRGRQWVSMPTGPHWVAEDSNDNEVVISNSSLQGTFKGPFDQLLTGSFRFTWVINSLYAMRPQVYDVRSDSGRSQDPEISAVVASLRDGKTRQWLVGKFSSGQTHCGNAAVFLEQK